MRNVQEADLAWSLIEIAKPHLNVLDRNYAFVTTGAGDTFAAIHHLLKTIAANRIPLHPRLAQLCLTWLDSYAFHEEEQYLRRLIEDFLLPDAIRALIAVRVIGLSTAPKCTEPHRVKRVVLPTYGAVIGNDGERRLVGGFRVAR